MGRTIRPKKTEQPIGQADSSHSANVCSQFTFLQANISSCIHVYMNLLVGGNWLIGKLAKNIKLKGGDISMLTVKGFVVGLERNKSLKNEMAL